MGKLINLTKYLFMVYAGIIFIQYAYNLQALKFLFIV
jgi:hypothetical protein